MLLSAESMIKLLPTITIISCVGVVAIVVLAIYAPTVSSMQAISIIIGFLAPTVVGLLSIMKAQENSDAIQDMREHTNNQLCEINNAASVAAVKANEVATRADQIAQVTIQTAQNVEAIKANGH